MLVGLISDTHGLVRPDVHTALAGAEMILHAGDVGEQDVLDELALIAPVQAVRGNTDGHGLNLPDAIDIIVGGVRIHVSHGHEVGRPTPEQLVAAWPGRDVIIYGHTHRQRIDQVGGTLVVNPGAAGARRFDLAPSVALLHIDDGHTDARIVALAE